MKRSVLTNNEKMEEVQFACLFNVLLFGAVMEMCRVRQYRHTTEMFSPVHQF